MRWQIHLRYLGTHYSGWQRQPDAHTVQQTLEEAFSLILRQPIEIVGCGRTDAGVHAREYVAHTEVTEVDLTDKIMYQINAVLPDDISIHRMREAASSFHARFDAVERAYRYYMHYQKDPFLHGISYYFPNQIKPDPDKLQAAAALLKAFDAFQPFCKTGSDADHFRCHIMESAWSFHDDGAVYMIKANRFLRGMVRLVVGACLNVALDKMTLDELRESLENQTPLPQPWSVPAEGLFLEEIVYKQADR